MKRPPIVRITAIMLSLLFPQVASASLGEFSFVSGTDSISLTDSNDALLGATPSSIGTQVIFGPFRTEDFTGANPIPGLSIDIVKNGNVLSMQKVSVLFTNSNNAGSSPTIKFFDRTNRNGNPDMEITIDNVTVPSPIDGNTTVDDFMLTSDSVLTYIQDGVVQCTIHAVPEPSAFLLLGVVGTGVCVQRIRRRRAEK